VQAYLGRRQVHPVLVPGCLKLQLEADGKGVKWPRQVALLSTHACRKHIMVPVGSVPRPDIPLDFVVVLLDERPARHPLIHLSRAPTLSFTAVSYGHSSFGSGSHLRLVLDVLRAESVVQCAQGLVDVAATGGQRGCRAQGASAYKSDGNAQRRLLSPMMQVFARPPRLS
jgi:hypothetical protein